MDKLKALLFRCCEWCWVVVTELLIMSSEHLRQRWTGNAQLSCDFVDSRHMTLFPRKWYLHNIHAIFLELPSCDDHQHITWPMRAGSPTLMNVS